MKQKQETGHDNVTPAGFMPNTARTAETARQPTRIEFHELIIRRFLPLSSSTPLAGTPDRSFAEFRS